MLATVDNCFGLIGPCRHSTANKQAQITLLWENIDRNRVGITVKEDPVEEVIKVKSLDGRIMKIAMVYGRKILHGFSVELIFTMTSTFEERLKNNSWLLHVQQEISRKTRSYMFFCKF